MKRVFICILFTICLLTLLYLIKNENKLFLQKPNIKLNYKKIKPMKIYEFSTYLQDGVPMVEIKINNSFFKCIFDTGSSSINLSHKDCKKCNTLDGSYKEKIKNKNNQFVIEYGSQIDTVVEETAKLILNEPIDVKVFLTIDRKAGLSGDSNHNVFGSMIPNSSHLNNFLKSTDCILCKFNEKNKKIIFCNQEFVYQLLKTNNYLSIKYILYSPRLPFYMVSVYKIEINLVDSYFNINKCIIDTGSNQTTFPEVIGNKIITSLQKSRDNSLLRIYFDKHNFISLTSKDLFWRASSFLMLDNDISALNDRDQHNSMILGCYNIRNRNFIFGSKNFYIEDV